jgi:hypothetical protein
VTANLVPALAGREKVTAAAMPSAAVSRHRLPARDLLAGKAG